MPGRGLRTDAIRATAAGKTVSVNGHVGRQINNCFYCVLLYTSGVCYCRCMSVFTPVDSVEKTEHIG